MNIIVYPNAKINIGLKVIEKRLDGFHNLETLFFPITLCDILEIVESNTLSIKHYGIKYALPENSLSNDLCIKAYNLLKADFDIPLVEIHLYKNIPIGAGLGGGSSDAAHTLIGLNSLFSLGLSDDKLAKYALVLGSDCPFFIYNKPMFGEGTGEILTPFEAEWTNQILGTNPKYRIEVITPDIQVSTLDAYQGIVPNILGKGLRSLLHLPIEQWKDTVVNDFEQTIFAKYPELEKEKNALYEKGAIYASMSGSGSALYGIFSNR